MSAINEIKEQMGVVQSVGSFTKALEQIATMRMTLLHDKVLASKHFVDEATKMLQELSFYKEMVAQEEYERLSKLSFGSKVKKVKKDPDEEEEEEAQKDKQAIIVMTSNQGLCGSYNPEIFKRFENFILPHYPDADIFIIGKKGQEHYANSVTGIKFKMFPYDLPDDFKAHDLQRLIELFPSYSRLMLVYTRFVNSAVREVVTTLLIVPPMHFDLKKGEVGDTKVRFIFEPSIDKLIKEISNKLRAATFQLQILDARLSQFSAQMVGMQSASENAKNMLGDLSIEYNKARRKIIDKKISEIFAGSAAW